MNTRARTARKIIKSRKNLPTRVQVRRSIVRPHSIASHLIRSGVSTETASGMAGSLSTVAKRLNLVPLAGRTRRTSSGRVRTEVRVNRYTDSQILVILGSYKPRKTEYKAARDLYLTAA